MSTIAVNQITDASGGSTAQINGATPTAYNTVGKNLIINGAMQVAQRGTSFTGLSDGNAQYTLDRWRWNESGTSTNVYTVEQSTDAPNNFSNSLKATVTTGGALDAGNMYRFIYNIEAQDCQRLGYGTSDAKEVTVSFWVKASEAADYSLVLYQEDDSRIISKTYTINAADTWEYKTVTFAGDTTGVIDNDNGLGIQLSFIMAVGSNFQGTAATTWGSYTNAKNAEGHTASQNSTSDYFAITGVQLEVGSVATEFERRPYGTELALCQRYYYKIFPGATQKAMSFYGPASDTDSLNTTGDFPVNMRTAPTALEVTGTASDYAINRAGIANYTCTSVPSHSTYTTNSIWAIQAFASGSLSTSVVYRLRSNSSDGYLAWSAEL